MIQTLRKCPECRKENCVYCDVCNPKHWEKNFRKWESGDFNIDEIIKDTQLHAKKQCKIIEWIEFSNFKEIEYIADGGYGKVYKAIWKDGPIENYEPWDTIKGKWRRKANTTVAIKILKVANGMTSLELSNEIKCNLKHNSLFINRVYGVTKEPSTQEYAVVTQFQEYGNLRDLVRKNHGQLSWSKCINILRTICNGLSAIHAQNYLHKDFHSGNILINRNYKTSIADFGQCRVTEESQNKENVIGVLPYVAPEVLFGGPFTKAADVYGFGIIMWELLSGELPFSDKKHGTQLAIEIYYSQLRPVIPDYVPKQCEYPRYNPNLLKSEIEKEFSIEKEEEWKNQLAKLANSSMPLKKTYQSYTSKHLDFTKILSQHLQSSKYTFDSAQQNLDLADFEPEVQ
ncbi:2139_t:CDS:2 [Cetraspora pellucida]|uniref:2139_t:CDS:1 n=1 Tax=Cetraspora pellucida TaxID=1433469 RepID=A0A9N8ZWV9_9GLOM|nr:2139_t:CDS:2 [Cetraspora pellucida]